MSQLLAAAVACAFAATAATATADTAPAAEPAPPPPPRLSLGVSAALWTPGGELVAGRDAEGAVGRSFPLQLHAGWRLTPELEVGLAGGYDVATVGSARHDECSDRGVTCDVHLWRAAARAEYRGRTGRWSPWGAALVGWERLVERWENDAANWERATWNGWLARLEAGIDAPAVRSFDIGIFVTFGLGQYRWRAVSGETVGYAYDDSGDVADPALHRWLGIGVRGTLGL
jgi:hypothetical protein